MIEYQNQRVPKLQNEYEYKLTLKKRVKAPTGAADMRDLAQEARMPRVAARGFELEVVESRCM